MPASLQVLYPVGKDTHFDHDYYANKHFVIVDDCAGEHIQSRVVTKGNASGPDTPPGYHAIANNSICRPGCDGCGDVKIRPRDRRHPQLHQ